jgi:WD40 repeat protein
VVKLWSIDSKNVTDIVQEGYGFSVYCVAFSSDSRFLAYDSNIKSIKIWDIEQKKELITLEGHKE